MLDLQDRLRLWFGWQPAVQVEEEEPVIPHLADEPPRPRLVAGADA
jgi:hypothetical protein